MIEHCDRLMITDTELMRQVKNGDESAFRVLVEKYQQQIRNLSMQYVGNHQDAEEVAQDVFIRLLRAADSYEPKGKLTTFLYRIAVNLSLNKIRDRKWKRWVVWESMNNNEMISHHSEDAEDPNGLLEKKEKQSEIRRVIDSLPANQKTAVLLKRYHGLSYEEIAEIMQCSVSAVESRLHRAKLSLKKKLAHLI